MTFDSLGLKPQILSALKEQGYTQPTPIQAQSIPVLLEGYDLLGTAQTGTGKTAAFTIPIIQNILDAPSERRRSIKALVVTPTRELHYKLPKMLSAILQEHPFVPQLFLAA